jgi:transcriptional regulator with XRE-family HTH domain
MTAPSCSTGGSPEVLRQRPLGGATIDRPRPAATRRRPVVQPHQHGSLTGYTYGCHCTSCKAANTRAGGKRRRRQAMGLTGPHDRLPYGPTHTAVCGLRSAGYTSPQIARLTGLSSTQISRLLRPGGQYVTRDVAERIDAGVRLSARVPPVDRLAARYLDVHGTRLRIRALMSQGWAVEELGRRLGHTGGYLSPVLYTSRRITPGLHAKVSRLYDELWQQTGPSTSTAKRAASRGWASPLELDDDRIDDPGYIPVLYRPTRQTIALENRQARVARQVEVGRLTELGWSAARIGEHLGVVGRQVVRDRARLAS